MIDFTSEGDTTNRYKSEYTNPAIGGTTLVNLKFNATFNNSKQQFSDRQNDDNKTPLGINTKRGSLLESQDTSRSHTQTNFSNYSCVSPVGKKKLGMIPQKLP